MFVWLYVCSPRLANAFLRFTVRMVLGKAGFGRKPFVFPLSRFLQMFESV